MKEESASHTCPKPASTHTHLKCSAHNEATNDSNVDHSVIELSLCTTTPEEKKTESLPIT